ncbi:MAG: extensin family protein [Methyloceanibacter sp.]|nr:extensin family protein [Methyloceanibacter sp.]
MLGARIAYPAALVAASVLLSSCGGGIPRDTRAEWRDRAEAQCMASGQVRAAPYVSQVPAIRGQSACSIAAPLRVSATQGGRVQVSPPALIGCPMTVALSRWVENSVQRAAFRQFQQPVVEIKQISSYSCRGRNSKSTGKLSEHSFGNALDVAGFTLADGQQITVVKGWWRGSAREKAFLREAFAGACRDFYTVLGPGSDRQHYNHFHVDLLVTNVTKGGKHYCRPQPTGGLFAAVEDDDPVSTASVKPIPFMGPPESEFQRPAFTLGPN